MVHVAPVDGDTGAAIGVTVNVGDEPLTVA
jgi:hypothetical protein